MDIVVFFRATAMNDVTQILSRMKSGDSTAADQLLPLIYDELRRLAAHKLAQESPGNTLQATALVHEAYLRLVDVDAPQLWNGRGHFFAAAAEAMRRILVNRARDKKRLKRGGGQKRLDWNRLEVADDASDDDLIAIDEALQGLTAEYPVCGELVKLRFFAGLTLDQAAECLGIGQRSADRYWSFARAWLYQELRGAGDPARK
ncbi:MAG: sigma-70 family RNA polymerase sigma factor [Pirellulales bacterium]